jgi:hypothetical protein
MGKRFTDTEIWDKHWFFELKPKLKCLVKFVRDKCDVAGVWYPNWALASQYVGEKVTEKELLSIDDGKQFKKFSDGKIYCIDFIEFQYGKLSEDCRPHKKIIATLKKHGLEKLPSKGIDTLSEIPVRVSDTLKDKEEEKEEDKEEETEEEKRPRESKKPKDVPVLFMDCDFYDFDKFRASFQNTDYEVYNIRYYYESVLNWSQSKGAKKLDWIATARNFMIRDAKDGKAVLQNQNLLSNATSQRFNQGKQSGLDYLKGSIAGDLAKLTGQSGANGNGSGNDEYAQAS